MSQLKSYYEKEVVPKLVEAFKYGNMMLVRKILSLIGIAR